MAVSSKPRKKYNPQFKLAKGVAMPNVMFRNSPNELFLFKLRPHLFLDLFKRDMGTKATLQGVAFRAGMLKYLAQHFNETDEILKIHDEAFQAINQILDRIRLSHQYTITEEEFNAVSLALSVMDDVQDLITRREHLQAAEKSLADVNANRDFGFALNL